MSNNSRRILSLLEILIRNSDQHHPIKENEIKAHLNSLEISIANRKTIYADISTLIDYGYDIRYDTFSKGYYLEESPFRLSETRILLDAISSLNNIDEAAKEELSDKILAFISIQEAKLLKENQLIKEKRNTLRTHKKDQSYIDKLEVILEAISTHHRLSFLYHDKIQEVLPYFLHYSNERYYLYVLFDSKDTVYSYRVDRMENISSLKEEYEFFDKKLNEIKERIRTSYDNYDKNTPEIIILETSKAAQLKDRLKDDFPNHYFNNEGNIVIEYRPNEIFFSKLSSYGTSLKIVSPEPVSKQYQNYLKSILEVY